MAGLIRYVETLAPYGDFQKVQEINAIIDNIIKSLSIQKGSYIADPEVGSNLFKYMYDFVDDFTLKGIETEIRSTLDYIDGVTLEDLKFEVTKDRKGIVAKITVEILEQVSKVITIVITQEYIDLISVEEKY